MLRGIERDCPRRLVSMRFVTAATIRRSRVPNWGGERGDGFGLAPPGASPAGWSFGGVVQQGCADDVRIMDAVVADDPDGDAEQVVDVGPRAGGGRRRAAGG